MTSADEALSEPLSTRRRTREQLADTLLDIGATLASYGCPSYRLEDVLREVALAEGYHAEPFAMPTGLFLRITPIESERDSGAAEVHRMKRLKDSGVDLDRLTLVDEIFNDVVAHKVTLEEARARIKRVVSKPPAWSAGAVWFATMTSSAAAAVFFRGSMRDVLVSAGVGAVVGGGRVFLGKPAQRLLQDFLGGLFAAACSGLAARVFSDVSPDVVMLAGAISLFPGMTFTTGLAEVAQKSLVSGGARLIESATTLLLILFGVALVASGQQIIGMPLHPPMLSTRVDLGLAANAAALVAASLSFGVIFQVPRRLWWAALVSGATGYAVTALATRHLPQNSAHVATFCAALAVCMLANGLARATNRPAQLYQLPGMMLLVPGSFGFLSLGEMLSGNVDQGAKNAFTMALVAAALVIGVLVANVLVPPRKLL